MLVDIYLHAWKTASGTVARHTAWQCYNPHSCGAFGILTAGAYGNKEQATTVLAAAARSLQHSMADAGFGDPDRTGSKLDACSTAIQPTL